MSKESMAEKGTSSCNVGPSRSCCHSTCYPHAERTQLPVLYTFHPLRIFLLSLLFSGFAAIATGSFRGHGSPGLGQRFPFPLLFPTLRIVSFWYYQLNENTETWMLFLHHLDRASQKPIQESQVYYKRMAIKGIRLCYQTMLCTRLYVCTTRAR